MSKDTPTAHDTILNTLQAAWRTRAAAQGLVCLVCRRIPAFERRHQFYDTGLCGACAEELAVRRYEGPN